MKFHLNQSPNIHLVNAFDGNAIVIDQNQYNSSLVISPDKLIEHWPVSNCSQLTPSIFAELVKLEPEILLLGTGKQIQFPDPQVRIPLIEANIGLEVMDTHAACRTYNILANEGRSVVAALMLQANIPIKLSSLR